MITLIPHNELGILLNEFVNNFKTKELLRLGLDAALNRLETRLVERLGDKVPLLGDLSHDALQFIRDLKAGINNRLSNLSDSTTSAIRAELFDLLHNELAGQTRLNNH